MAVGILLVGGRGTRLQPLTNESPKPMLPVAGLPVTEHQILAAKKAGIQTLVLATSYLDRKSTRLNSSHVSESRMPSSA